MIKKNRAIVVGMVHLLPLPGSPSFGGSFSQVVGRALREATVLEEGGVDALLLENYGDAPFFPESVPPETVAAMAVAAGAVKERISLPLGINVLRNDARAALAIAQTVGASFIRANVLTGAVITDQGIIQGRAAELTRQRAALKATVQIWADVMVKHSASLGEYPLEQAAKDTAYRGMADALIISGTGTGTATSVDDLKIVRAAIPDRPLLVGSGVNSENIARLRSHADGFIVGTSLKVKGITTNPVSPARLRRFMQALGRK